jgi:phosphoribosylformylglycinamidine (FGAM) synthase PurS component
MTIVARVHRKTRDLVRDAAEDVLRARSAPVAVIDRAEQWTFRTTAEDAQGDVHRILDETTLVVNPNLHRYRLEEETGAPGTGSRIEIVVHDRVDAKGASVLRAVRERRGIRSITGVSRAIVWTLDVTGSEEDAEQLARAVTGGDGHGAGILANPHSQEVTWRVISG